jgi:antitoxin component YwqK of YwqJK toxin-antitoxin module
MTLPFVRNILASPPDGVWEFYSPNGLLFQKIKFENGTVKRLFFGEGE